MELRNYVEEVILERLAVKSRLEAVVTELAAIEEEFLTAQSNFDEAIFAGGESDKILQNLMEVTTKRDAFKRTISDIETRVLPGFPEKIRIARDKARQVAYPVVKGKFDQTKETIQGLLTQINDELGWFDNFRNEIELATGARGLQEGFNFTHAFYLISNRLKFLVSSEKNQPSPNYKPVLGGGTGFARRQFFD